MAKRNFMLAFFYLEKAFDTVDRTILLYKLLSKYQIGGSFLKLLQEMYQNNQMYVKLSSGLTQPFLTTMGVKQGCVLSPLIFNLFINDLPDQFDDQCDPLILNGKKVQALMFADDVMIFSQSATGLKRVINITVGFFNNINLSVNFSKTQVMIFNSRGVLLDKDPQHKFFDGDHLLKVVAEYTYLGIKLTPSGAASAGADELFAKSRRSWFSISNLIYRHKRMATDKALQIFDQLVTSIGLYSCESWLPLIMTKKSFSEDNNLFSFWENFKLETLNQKICRMLLSVHKKSSRLAVLGELGRFPLLIKGLCHVLKYQAKLLQTVDNGSIVSNAVIEMKSNSNPNLNSWWGRVEKIKQNFGIKYSPFSKLEAIGCHIKKQVKGKFEIYWLREVNKIKLGDDNKNHNKLRYYATIKGCFKKESYLDLVPNRSQRSDLTRLRISSSRLAIEVQRYQRPKVPENERWCKYCRPGPGPDNNIEGYVDNEEHFLTSCCTFTLERNCLYARMESLKKGFIDLSPAQQAATLMCPTSTVTAKLANKYIKLLFETRQNLDNGVPALNLGFECAGIFKNIFFGDLDD